MRGKILVVLIGVVGVAALGLTQQQNQMFTGISTGRMLIEVNATTQTLDALDVSCKVITNGGDADGSVNNLPSAVQGMCVVFASVEAQVITVDAADGDTILGIAGVAAGESIDSPGAVGDYIKLVAVDDAEWAIVAIGGAWADGDP